MVTYEVSASIDDESIAVRYEHYMSEKHLRDVLASGCFVEAVLERAGSGKYRTRYVARSQADVDRYLAEHTAALRKDFAEHFPHGIELSRATFVELTRQQPSG